MSSANACATSCVTARSAARIKKPSPETSRRRVLNEDEIRRVWRLLSHLPTTRHRPAPGRKRAKGEADDPLCPVSPTIAALLRVRLLTAQRGGEVSLMRWQDVTLPADDAAQIGWWTIPAEDAKNGQPHRVPLTADAVALIKAQAQTRDQRGIYVFTGEGGAAVFHRAKKAPTAIARVLAMDFRGHDLRRTAATQMAATGIPREHIAHVLNHVEGGSRATKVYDRYSYDNEKRAALEAWARRLTDILAQRDASGRLLPFAATAVK